MANNPAPASNSGTLLAAGPESMSSTTDFSAALDSLFNGATQPVDELSTTPVPEHTGRHQKNDAQFDPASPLPAGTTQVFATQTIPFAVPLQQDVVSTTWNLSSSQAVPQSSALRSVDSSPLQGGGTLQGTNVSSTMSPLAGYSGFVAAPNQEDRNTGLKTSANLSSGAPLEEEVRNFSSGSACKTGSGSVPATQQQALSYDRGGSPTFTSIIASVPFHNQGSLGDKRSDATAGLDRSTYGDVSTDTPGHQGASSPQTYFSDQGGPSGPTSIAGAPLRDEKRLSDESIDAASAPVTSEASTGTVAENIPADEAAASPEETVRPEIKKTEDSTVPGDGQGANVEMRATATDQPITTNPVQTSWGAHLLQPAVEAAPSSMDVAGTAPKVISQPLSIGMSASAPVHAPQPSTQAAVNVSNRVTSRRSGLQIEAPLTGSASAEQVASVTHAAAATNKSDLTKDTANTGKAGADDIPARAQSDAQPVPVLPPTASIQTIPSAGPSSLPHAPDASLAQASASVKDGQAAALSAAPDATSAGHTSSSPGGSYPAVSTSRLIQTLGQSEMRVGLRSSEFGDISIRTSTTSDDLSAQISLSHEDLAKSLTAHIPDVQAKIGANIGFEITVNTADRHTGTTSSLSDMGAGSQGSRQQGQNTGSSLSRYIPGSMAGQSLSAITPVSATRNPIRDGRIDLQA